MSVLDDLAAVGYPVGSVSELRTSGLRYREAVPVLLQELSKATSWRNKEVIVRALSVPWAKDAALVPLIQQFAAKPSPSDAGDESLRWAVGNALEVLWDDKEFDSLRDLAADPRFGRARQMVVLGMRKSKRPEAIDALIRLADDPDVDGHAVKALRALRTPEARPVFERNLADRRAWVRSEARRGLERLG